MQDYWANENTLPYLLQRAQLLLEVLRLALTPDLFHVLLGGVENFASAVIRDRLNGLTEFLCDGAPFGLVEVRQGGFWRNLL